MWGSIWCKTSLQKYLCVLVGMPLFAHNVLWSEKCVSRCGLIHCDLVHRSRKIVRDNNIVRHSFTSRHRDGWSGPSDAGMNWFIHALSWREFVQFLNRWLSSHRRIAEALNLHHGYCTKNLHHWWAFPTLILHNFVILTSKKITNSW